MPTTATLASPPIFSAEQIASGLLALGSLLESTPWLTEKLRFPGVPQSIALGVSDRASVEALASEFGTRVQNDTHGDHVYVSTVAELEGLRVTVYAVLGQPRVLRRDPEATAALAERDA